MNLLDTLGLRKQKNTEKQESKPTTKQYKALHESVASHMQPPSFGVGMQGLPDGNYIGDSFYDTGGVFGNNFNNPGLLEIERGYIIQQRAVSMLPEVAIGIEEIMRDLFDPDNPMEIDTTLTPKEVDMDKLYRDFQKFKKNPFTVVGDRHTPQSLLLFNLLRQAYVDGHLCLAAIEIPRKLPKISDQTDYGWHITSNIPRARKPTYSSPKDSMVWGFQVSEKYDAMLESISDDLDNHRMVRLDESDLGPLLEAQLIESPKDSGDEKHLIFVPLDPARVVFKGDQFFYDMRRDYQIQLKENSLIMADFGLYDVTGARYGFLQYAFKYANQLQTLQDMLVPMRFRRSVARRIFNVDVGNLPQARAAEAMKEIQRKFKYKKSYDYTNGRIKSTDNEQIGIVEDYWFASRNGSKGTTVDMMDEAGNFADSLDDISYFNKKLYQSMFIPLRRIFESDAEYDYTTSNIEVDEVRFYSFLRRLRSVYNAVFTKQFAMYLKSLGYEDEVVNGINVSLHFDDFITKNRKYERFESAMRMFEEARSLMGEAFSAETMMKMLFDLTPEDVKREFDKIKGELEEDSIFYPMYIAKAKAAESDY